MIIILAFSAQEPTSLIVSVSVCIFSHLLQLSSVTQACPTLCDPMDCSTPGFPVPHQLPELAQTHVHQGDDAIQPSHSLSSPSPPALIFPSSRVFSDVSVLHIRWPEYWTFSFSISPSNDYLRLTLGLTLCTRL